MKRQLLSIVLAICTPNAYAGGDCTPQPKRDETSRIVTKRTVPKSVTPKTTCCTPANTMATMQNTAQESTQVTRTGNQTVIVRLDGDRAKRYSVMPNKNHLLLLVGSTPTDFVLARKDCCTVGVDKKRELDLGALYVRDIDQFSLGAVITGNGNFYIGFGFNF